MSLPSYRIHLDNGTSYVTSMGANVSIEQARAYFVDNWFEKRDGHLCQCVNVTEA